MRPTVAEIRADAAQMAVLAANLDRHSGIAVECARQALLWTINESDCGRDPPSEWFAGMLTTLWEPGALQRGRGAGDVVMVDPRAPHCRAGSIGILVSSGEWSKVLFSGPFRAREVEVFGALTLYRVGHVPVIDPSNLREE